MFVSKRAYLIAFLIFNSDHDAHGDTWAKLPQSGGSGTWSRVVCEAGSGWRPCKEKAFQCNYTSTYHAILKPACRGKPGQQGWYYVLNGITYRSGQVPSQFLPVSAGSRVAAGNLYTCGNGDMERDIFYEVCYTK